MRARFVSGVAADFDDAGTDRVRDLDLLVFRAAERVAALGFGLDLVMRASMLCDAIRRTTSAPPVVCLGLRRSRLNRIEMD